LVALSMKSPFTDVLANRLVVERGGCDVTRASGYVAPAYKSYMGSGLTFKPRPATHLYET
jgi:hypothetical protein